MGVGCFEALGRFGGREGRKAFFFGKKKQKTFAPLSRDVEARVSGTGNRGLGRRGQLYRYGAVVGQMLAPFLAGFLEDLHAQAVGDQPGLGRAAGEDVVDEGLAVPAGVGAAGGGAGERGGGFQGAAHGLGFVQDAVEVAHYQESGAFLAAGGDPGGEDGYLAG